MATMSDLAFLINVFLMAALLFSVNQGLLLELPQSSAAGKVERSEVVLEISADGRVYADGRLFPVEGIGDYAAAARRGSPPKPVIVKSDRRVEYGRVIDVMDRLLRAGITDVALPTAAEERRM